MERIKGPAIFVAYWLGASAAIAACWTFTWTTLMDKTAVVQNWTAAIIGVLIAGFLIGGLFWGMTTPTKTPTKPFRFSFGAWWIGFAVLIGMMSHPHGVSQYGLVAVFSLFFALLVWGVINGRYERAKAIAESDSRKVLAIRLHDVIFSRAEVLVSSSDVDYARRIITPVVNGCTYVAEHGSLGSRPYWHGVVDGRKFLLDNPENRVFQPIDAAFRLLIADDFDPALVETAITKI